MKCCPKYQAFQIQTFSCFGPAKRQLSVHASLFQLQPPAVQPLLSSSLPQLLHPREVAVDHATSWPALWHRSQRESVSAPLPHYSHSPPKGLAELLSCCLFSQVVWEQAQQAAGDMSFNRHLCSNKHLWLNLSLVITPFIWIFFTWIQESWKQCCSRYNFQALQFGALFSSQLFLFNWKRNINPAAQSK